VVVETGGFVASFIPDTDSPYLDYATPLPGAEPTERARRRGTDRGPPGTRPATRLEFAPRAAPGVEPVLRAAGFDTEAVHEYLVCSPHTLTVPQSADSPRVERPTSDEEYAELPR
jgi:hypothetical protein